MIQFVKGDFFDFQADARVNTVNCVGVMGAGVALLFKNKYPKMYDEYVRECLAGNIQPGSLHIWNDFENKNSPIIINFPTKNHWRNPSEYEYIETGLIALREYLSNKGKITITVPALGCGHGGLDWDRVQLMITNSLQGLEANVLVFEPASSLVKESPEQIQNLLKANGVGRLVPGDHTYPKILRNNLDVEVYFKGNINALQQKTLSVIVDSKADEREKAAVFRCVDTFDTHGFNYLLGFNNSFEIDIVKYVLEKRSRVILVIACGILEMKVRNDLKPYWDENLITILSFTKPTQSWKVSESFNALKCRIRMSSAVLIGNLNLESLQKFETDLRQFDNPIYYINYWDSQVEFYKRINAKQIGRSKVTQLPNVEPIMNHLNFIPYHNRHIRFRLKNGVELSGVVVDSMNYRDKSKPRTVYTFIPTSNMWEWKDAESRADTERLKQLQKEVDITDIVWAEQI